MDITFLGHSTFKIKAKNATVITDPYDPKMLGLKFPKTPGDIVTISHEHPDHNSLDQVSDIRRAIKGPGEYEILGVSMIGLPSYHDDKEGAERGKNTIFVFEMDNMRIAHLGDLGHTLSDKLVEEIGTIDILLIPVGGFYTINTEQALSVFRAIDPSIVIPMHYKEAGINPEIAENLTSEEEFVKQSGLTLEKMDKLSIKKIDIPEEGQRLIVLERKV